MRNEISNLEFLRHLRIWDLKINHKNFGFAVFGLARQISLEFAIAKCAQELRINDLRTKKKKKNCVPAFGNHVSDVRSLTIDAVCIAWYCI